MNTMRPPVLPPGLSDEGFTAAMGRLADAVGAEHVVTDAGLEGYGDPYAFTAPEACWPSAAVRPASVEEVQAVLAVANEYRIQRVPPAHGRPRPAQLRLL